MENGMVRVSGQLDPEAGAVLRAALDPLSAPHPGTPNPTAPDPWAVANASPADTAGIGNNGYASTAKPGTCRDLRPPDRRRAEALIEICRRAAAAGGGAPATTKASEDGYGITRWV
jgi:hypothetical protein